MTTNSPATTPFISGVSDALNAGVVAGAVVTLPFAFAEPTPEKISPVVNPPVEVTVGEPVKAPLELPVIVIDVAIVPEILFTVIVFAEAFISCNVEVTV